MFKINFDQQRIRRDLTSNGYSIMRVEGLCPVNFMEFGSQLGDLSTPIDCLKNKGLFEVDEVQIYPGKRLENRPLGNTTPHHEDSCSQNPPDVVIIGCLSASEANLNLVDMVIDDATAGIFGETNFRHSTDKYNSFTGAPISAYHPAISKTLNFNKRSLFANPLFTDEITESEDSNISKIFWDVFATAKSFDHTWKPGDIIAFDNRRFVHFGNLLPESGSKHLIKVHITMGDIS